MIDSNLAENKYALLSVYDKEGIVEFAEALSANNYTIIATGKTALLLKNKGINVVEISEFTGFEEILDGRVKTLHPKVFGSILFRRENNSDILWGNKKSLVNLDILCVNLYPFSKVFSQSDSTLDDLIENIDIGGVSLIRAAAKNCKYVSILTASKDYFDFLDKLKKNEVTEEYRRKLAVQAFMVTAKYDNLIATGLQQRFETDNVPMVFNEKPKQILRYGENPHQKGYLYGSFDEYYDHIHGKELSYNNILDLVSAVELSEECPVNSAVIIKHNIPCGVAVGADIKSAFTRALSCDPISAFGGIVVLNEKVDVATALELNRLFLEVVAAPDFEEDALSILFKKKERRVIKLKKRFTQSELKIRTIPGGYLAQDSDSDISEDFKKFEYKTGSVLSEEILSDCRLAWIVSKHAKSNAVVFVKNGMTVGIGAGQVSRIDAVKIAIMKAAEFNHSLQNAVVGSDAFFPFRDNVENIVATGATVVVQPGGSVKDTEVIEAAKEYNITMIFTGTRHFKH